ncbi:ComEA family DNA-binding protein [Nocardioides sp. CFH 31398]|uniref:ComEA family DNA-binding protein n=1 Tax=Nocardioides sp. CFH 31398 TaxID=2919579 RepID=UPI001F05C694|nr:ComEA family DNA-binding protein [Nocardioides sp. CFH 31398]MCH1868412.1 ComEA family DNA-binding protein [Nocardioides sp. CFH 31398]
MRPRRPSTDQQEAIARRLALLDAELSAVRTGEADAERSAPPPSWDVAPAVGGGPPPAARWVAPDTHTRPRPPAGEDDDEHEGVEDDEGEVRLGAVPRTGRHATRRASPPRTPGLRQRLGPTGWVGLVPETLQGRAGLGAAHLAVVAVLVSVGLGVTCWWVLRSGPEPLPATAPVSALVTPGATGGAAGSPGSTAPASPVAGALPGAPTPGGSTGATPGGAVGGEVVVDVAGRVRRPGIVVLPSGSRVADALEAAGGARPGTDLTPLNLARVLLDGEQVLVGVDPAAGGGLPVPGDPGSTGTPPGPAAPPAPGAPVALVNVNTADLATLDTLPGVGPVTAQAIVDWRTENGGFSAVADLLDVSGIGEVTLAELTPLVTV